MQNSLARRTAPSYADWIVFNFNFSKHITFGLSHGAVSDVAYSELLASFLLQYHQRPGWGLG